MWISCLPVNFVSGQVMHMSSTGRCGQVRLLPCRRRSAGRYKLNRSRCPPSTKGHRLIPCFVDNSVDRCAATTAACSVPAAKTRVKTGANKTTGPPDTPCGPVDDFVGSSVDGRLTSLCTAGGTACAKPVEQAVHRLSISCYQAVRMPWITSS
jgi:hypothetical protein